MFDAHCDTLLKILDGASLHKNDFDVSFKKLATYGKAVQLFALFNCGDYNTLEMLDIIDSLKREAEKSPLAAFCVSAEDIENNPNPVSAFVSIEGMGNTIGFKADDVRKLYDSGVRVASLTWNNDNPLCGGISENKDGITTLGEEVLANMGSLGMVLDVSHISDKGFDDVFEMYKGDIVATHSNSRTVCVEPRNLTDEQFKTIIKRGGVVGVNTYPQFINGTNTANVFDLIRHIEHFCSLGGEKSIGLGADFDGIDFKMTDINSCEKMNILIEELAKLNYPEETIRGIYCENFLNFFKK